MSPRKKDTNGLRTALLGFFLEKSFHGYELFKNITQISEFKIIWNIKQSLFYNHLDVLNQEGLLDKNVLEGSQYPDRKIYKITQKGKDVFLNWLVEPVSHGREMRQEFLAKLFFAIKQKKEIEWHLIQAQKNECNRWITEIKKEKLAQMNIYQDLIFDYRIKQIEAMIEWLNFVESEQGNFF